MLHVPFPNHRVPDRQPMGEAQTLRQ
jgi:hypothetical protein